MAVLLILWPHSGLPAALAVRASLGVMSTSPSDDQETLTAAIIEEIVT